jgi:RNA polymerase sigma factor (sigma-70 family)
MTTLIDAVRHVRRVAEGSVLRDWPDRRLLERFTLDRDEAAFAELVRRHGPMVLGVCRRVLGHEQDAEDAFQAAFLVLARKAGSIRQHDSIGGWLYQVAHRLAVRARMARERRRRYLTSFEDESFVPVVKTPGDALVSLDEELQRLPDRDRTLLVLCYLEGRSQSEAARLLAITTDAVNSRLKRARDLLRRRLTRGGRIVSTAALAKVLSSSAAEAALPAPLLRLTVRGALNFISNQTPVSALAVALAKGVLHAMIIQKIKVLSAVAVGFVLLSVGGLLFGTSAPAHHPDGDVHATVGNRVQFAQAKPSGRKQAGQPKPIQRSCIILWMSGGPSQIDTFDPKPGSPNAGLFTPMDTAVKGVQFSQNLPNLAKLANHLAVIRSVSHKEGDHGRSTYLMRTGRSIGSSIAYPALGCVLGKELGASRPDLPRYLSLAAFPQFAPAAFGPGFLGPEYAPVFLRGQGGFGAAAGIPVPPADAFETQAKGRGEKLRKAVAKAFDLNEEKQEVRTAYGPDVFGQGCLLARRLVERGVPVVELSMAGWDTHTDNFNAVHKRSAILDSALGSLLKDLHERKRLDTTLVVWMGEFGRTPRINPQMGRDHWPYSFSVVLAGGGIKGGQVIGKTDADGVKIVERPVTPPELFATIYQALGIDPAKEYRVDDEQKAPLAEAGSRAVKEALR